MGYYSEKYPQCREAYELDKQIEDDKAQAEYENYLLNRKENHEKALVERIATSIECFSDSINNLAKAISVQKPPMNVNINGLDDSNALKHINKLIRRRLNFDGSKL